MAQHGDKGLSAQFEKDFENVFAKIDEFAAEKTFEIKEGHQTKQFTTNVVWDTETLKERAIVQQQGVYLGSVLMFIAKKYFDVEPRPEEIIYEIAYRGKLPVKIGWRILDITDAEYVYEISLDRVVV
jgi:hypothetical protein